MFNCGLDLFTALFHTDTTFSQMNACNLLRNYQFKPTNNISHSIFTFGGCSRGARARTHKRVSRHFRLFCYVFISLWHQVKYRFVSCRRRQLQMKTLENPNECWVRAWLFGGEWRWQRWIMARCDWKMKTCMVRADGGGCRLTQRTVQTNHYDDCWHDYSGICASRKCWANKRNQISRTVE